MNKPFRDPPEEVRKFAPKEKPRTMVRRIFTELQFEEGRPGESSRDLWAESWAPPVAPAGMPAPAHARVLIGEYLIALRTRFLPHILSKVIAENVTHFRWYRNLTAGVVAVVGALGLCAVAYFFGRRAREHPR